MLQSHKKLLTNNTRDTFGHNRMLLKVGSHPHGPQTKTAPYGTAFICGPCGTRTHDPLLAKQVF